MLGFVRYLAGGAHLQAVRGVDALHREAATSRREDFERVINAVPDCPPPDFDRLG